ncbi:MAG: hypothetical protein PVH80_07345, partial [Anaerolineae bacterium]
GGEVETHAGVEEGGGLPGGEAEVSLTQLGQLAAPAQPGDRQGWVGAGGDDQVQAGRQVVEQEGERVVDGLGRDEVVVVEDEDDLATGGFPCRLAGCRAGRDVVDEGGEDRFSRWRPGGLERGQGGLSDARLHGLQGGDEVGEEAGQVVVALVEGEPG